MARNGNSRGSRGGKSRGGAGSSNSRGGRSSGSRTGGGLGGSSNSRNGRSSGSRNGGGLGGGSNSRNGRSSSSRTGGGLGGGSNSRNGRSSGSRTGGGLGGSSNSRNGRSSGSRAGGGLGGSSNSRNGRSSSSRTGGGLGSVSNNRNGRSSSSRTGGGLGSVSNNRNGHSSGSKTGSGLGSNANSRNNRYSSSRSNGLSANSINRNSRSSLSKSKGLGVNTKNRNSHSSLSKNSGIGTSASKHNNRASNSSKSIGINTTKHSTLSKSRRFGFAGSPRRSLAKTNSVSTTTNKSRTHHQKLAQSTTLDKNSSLKNRSTLAGISFTSKNKSVDTKKTSLHVNSLKNKFIGRKSAVQPTKETNKYNIPASIARPNAMSKKPKPFTRGLLGLSFSTKKPKNTLNASYGATNKLLSTEKHVTQPVKETSKYNIPASIARPNTMSEKPKPFTQGLLGLSFSTKKPENSSNVVYGVKNTHPQTFDHEAFSKITDTFSFANDSLEAGANTLARASKKLGMNEASKTLRATNSVFGPAGKILDLADHSNTLAIAIKDWKEGRRQKAIVGPGKKVTGTLLSAAGSAAGTAVGIKTAPVTGGASLVAIPALSFAGGEIGEKLGEEMWDVKMKDFARGITTVALTMSKGPVGNTIDLIRGKSSYQQAGVITNRLVNASPKVTHKAWNSSLTDIVGAFTGEDEPSKPSKPNTLKDKHSSSGVTERSQAQQLAQAMSSMAPSASGNITPRHSFDNTFGVFAPSV